MKKCVIAILVTCVGAFAWAADDANSNANTELQRATETVQNITSAPADKGVPNQVLEGAKCVAVIPKLVKGAFVVGGEHGKGVATCKNPATNQWRRSSAPFRSQRNQLGSPDRRQEHRPHDVHHEADEGIYDLMRGHVKLGADVSAAAGPVGRTASAEAGYKAGILTYSASKGAFIGALLNGAELNQDHKLTKGTLRQRCSFCRDSRRAKLRPRATDARDFVNAVQNAKETAQTR